MGTFHDTIYGLTNMHPPLGWNDGTNPDQPLQFVAGYATALTWQYADADPALTIDTSGGDGLEAWAIDAGGDIDIIADRTLELKDGSSTYFQYDATVSPTLVTLGSTISRVEVEIKDDEVIAYRVKEGANQYFGVSTSNGLEIVSFGNSVTNPASNFVGSGNITMNSAIDMKENTAVPGGAPSSARGKLWVRDDSPNVLVFTNDVGTDTVLGGIGSTTLDTAYTNGPEITIDSGAMTLTVTSPLSLTHPALLIEWDASTFTGTPHGIRLDAGSVVSVTNAADVYGIDLQGVTNSGSGKTVGVFIDSGWDVGLTSNRNVGLGTVTAPTSLLQIGEGTTNADKNTLRIDVVPTASSSGTYNVQAANVKITDQDVDSGVTNSGQYIAGRFDAFAEGTNFQGTINTQIGLNGRAGISTPIGASGARTVENAYGVFADVLNLDAAGTITNAYGVYINNDDAVGTITNRFDLYASSTNAKSYVAGTLGVGDTTQSAKLTVNQSVAATVLDIQDSGSSVFRVEDGASANTTRYQMLAGQSFGRTDTIVAKDTFATNGTDTLASYTTVAGTAGWADVTVIAARSGVVNYYDLRAKWINTGGTLTVTTVDPLNQDEDVVALNITITNSGQDLIVQVTTDGTPTNWGCRFKVQFVNQ
ncbi:MAG: hypothetical protein GTO22_14535 [Gemmatimonadales bacterium]|nr:hypothetical protein [Gemmatimonadales bacterium]